MSDRILPSIDDVVALADCIATLGPRVDGRPAGDRLRSLILVAGTCAPRPGELTRHQPDWIEWGTPTMLRFCGSESPEYDPEFGVKGLQLHPLKHREWGESREVPAQDEVADALRIHLERGYAGHDRTWTSPTGRGRLNWGSLMQSYWRPGCQKVFGGTEKQFLVNMPPKMLRKAAVTFWLESGISHHLVAEWAGHSPEVLHGYYAGRTALDYAAEVEKMRRHREGG